jgi:hypothetical protein
MAIVNLPEFEDQEILTATKMNAFVATLNSKFDAGFDAGDLIWPLDAQGNINMGDYAINGATKIFSVVNASQYTTLDDAVTAAGSGGCVFIPPNTTIAVSGSTTWTASNLTIMGCGPSSVIQFTGTPADGQMLKALNAGSEIAGFTLMNLTLDGNSKGTGQAGLVLSQVSDVRIQNVTFEDFTGVALRLTNSGTEGAECDRVWIDSCYFSGGTGGSSYHIHADDVANLLLTNVHSASAPNKAIVLVATHANHILHNIRLAGVQIDTPGETALHIAGQSGTASENWSDVWVEDVIVETPGGSGDAIIVGSSSGVLKRARVVRCQARSSPAHGLVANIETGEIVGCDFRSATGDAIDLEASADLRVYDNDLQSAGAYSIDATSATDVTIHDNDFRSASTGGIAVNTADTTREWYNNRGQDYNIRRRVFEVDFGESSHTGNTSRTQLKAITIPANILRAGDVVKITALCSRGAATNGNMTFTLDFDGADIGSIQTSNDANDEANLASNVYILSTTQGYSWFHGEVNTAALESAGHNVGTPIALDTTTSLDVGIDVQLANGSDAGLCRGLIIEFVGSDA